MGDGLLCEQLIMHGYCVCVIDPEGDYTSLEALPGVTVLGGEDPPPTPRDLIRALRYPDRSVVIDLSRRPHEEKLQHIRALLPALNVLRQRTGLPHRIVLDEAHYYLHGADAPRLLDLERHGYTVVTYCASRLPKELLADTEVMIVTSQSNPAEVDALCRYCVACTELERERWSILGHLKAGQAVALPITEEAGGELRLFTMAPRLTPHVRHRREIRGRAGGRGPSLLFWRERSTVGAPGPDPATVRGGVGGRTGGISTRTCAGGTSHDGSPMCSATTPSQRNCGYSKSGIAWLHTLKRCPRWSPRFGRGTTSWTTTFRRSTTECPRLRRKVL